MNDILRHPIFWLACVAAAAALIAVLALLRAAAAGRRAASAERRLTNLFGEVEAAIGREVDRAPGGAWRDQVGNGLRQLAKVARIGRDGGHAMEGITCARAMLAAAAEHLESLQPESPSGRSAATLRLEERLEASRSGLAAIEGSEGLEAALSAGVLNDILTTASLLDAYFADVTELAVVVQGYRAADAAIRLELQKRGVMVDTPGALSIAFGRDVQGESVDGRELRRIEQARTAANRVADRLGPGEKLILYSSTPGWSGPRGNRPPTVVTWSSSSWLV